MVQTNKQSSSPWKSRCLISAISPFHRRIAALISTISPSRRCLPFTDPVLLRRPVCLSSQKRQEISLSLSAIKEFFTSLTSVVGGTLFNKPLFPLYTYWFVFLLFSYFNSICRLQFYFHYDFDFVCQELANWCLQLWFGILGRHNSFQSFTCR